MAANAAEPDSKPYIYTPLPDNSIRVLEILPGQPTDPLSCSILIHSFPDTERLPYEALSYTWGSPDRVSQLFCNGGDECIPITASLSTALHHLRLTDRPRRIWADAVCINQTDFEEKGTQIGLMAQIYSRAKRTVVWLGESDETTELAIETLFNIAQNCLSAVEKEVMEDVGQMLTMNPMHVQRDVIERSSHAYLPVDDREKWEAVARFFDASWFSRIWCIQEVTLGNSPLLYRGTQSIPWSTVLLSSLWASHWVEGLPKPVQMNMVLFMHCIILHGSFLDPSTFVSSARAFDATDPRDLIYALLSFKPLKFHPVYSITADYHLTVAEVYMKAVVACVMQSKRLGVLLQVQHADSSEVEDFDTPGRDLREDGFPTWVPRWDNMREELIPMDVSGKGAAEGLATMHEMRGDDTEGTGLELLFGGDVEESRKGTVRGSIPRRDKKDVTKDTGFERLTLESSEGTPLPKTAITNSDKPGFGFAEPVITLPKTPGDTSLTIRCIRIGICLSGTQPLYRGWWEPTKSFPIPYDLVTSSPKYIRDGDNTALHKEIATVLVAGHLPHRVINNTPDSEDEDLLGNMMLMSCQTTRDWLEGRKEEAERKMSGDENVEAFYLREVNRRSSGRRLFTLSNGHMGNGPAAMRAGDVVVVAYGANAPLVLRRIENKWLFVGSCYVYGFMGGEAAEMYKSRKLEMELIELV